MKGNEGQAMEQYINIQYYGIKYNVEDMLIFHMKYTAIATEHQIPWPVDRRWETAPRVA